MWRLQDSHTEALVVQPESGMGYQIVRATVNSRTQLVFVFNAELCLELSELADVPSISFEEILDDAKFVNSFSAQQILAVEQVQELWLSGGAGGLPTAPTPIRPATAAGGALAPSPLIIRTSRPHEGFVRLSASPSDYRIMSNGEVRKGRRSVCCDRPCRRWSVCFAESVTGDLRLHDRSSGGRLIRRRHGQAGICAIRRWS